MTSPAGAIVAGQAQSDGSAAAGQLAARAFVVAFHAAVHAVRLYPVENSAVQKSLHELTSSLERILAAEDSCELRRVDDYLFVNGTRLRLGLDNYAAVASVLALFRESGVGAIRVKGSVEARAWVVLMAFMQAPPLEFPEEERLAEIECRLSRAGVDCFELEPAGSDAADDSELDGKERARQTYMRGLDVTRDMMTQVRLGRSAGLRRVKRAVQGIVDTILSDPSSLIGLTTLREFDEYTFVHSVNVCILSVALGRRLALTKFQLLDLGLAALLHDIGKSRTPLETLNKRASLDDHERTLLQEHTWQGVLAMFALPTGAGRPYRAMVAAFQHHLRIDLSGYPRTLRTRELSLFSKIIAVADGFDAATTTRVYQANPWSPADVLRGMRDNARLGFDAVVVKAFINLTGIYPVGTLVVLDTFEMGVVHEASPDASALSRPLVRLLSDTQGNMMVETSFADLTERTDSGSYLRTIIRTEDPERYGIRIGDYFA
ncbi:MAG: HD domain-containing protein [Gemmatimonadota bacterium]|nr:HD domain-containing protein [Gemmatimonadota bacterium]